MVNNVTLNYIPPVSVSRLTSTTAFLENILDIMLLVGEYFSTEYWSYCFVSFFVLYNIECTPVPLLAVPMVAVRSDYFIPIYRRQIQTMT